MRIVPLSEARDEGSFGGKASALARALESGLPVPEGFALSWETVAAIGAGDEQGTAEATRWFENLGGPVSVRSSAIGEDSADASFAGQHATVLNVITSDDFLEAIRTVHSSAVADSARAYRIRVGIDAPARIAVAVQRMIRSDCAGVLFTRNPLNGAEERLIESSWGLGEAVVAGLVSPDRYRLSASGAVLERTAGMKDVAVVMRPEGHTAQEDVAADKVNVLTLSDGQLAELHRLAKQVEMAFGPDQDLEWAFQEGRLYLLQARPITRIAPSAAIASVEAERSATQAATVDSPPSSPHAPFSTLSRRRFAGLGLAALLAPLNSTIIAVALPSIGADLEADPASITRWLVTSYLIVSIIAQSPAGKLGDVLGYSRVLTAGRVLFGAGALLSVFANHLLVLAAGRIAMAVGGSLTIPTVMAELRNSTPPERRGRVFGTFGAIMGTAAGAGPLLGGLLTARFGWHSIFILNLPVIILSLILEPPHRDRTAQRKGGIDLLGSVLFGAGILALLVGTQKPVSVFAILIGVLLIFVFVMRELRAEEPMLDIRLFTRRSFAAGSSIVALQNLAMYATLFLLPFLLSGHQRASGAGMALMALTAAMVVASPIGGRMTDRLGPRLTAAGGAMLAGVGATILYTGPIGLTARTFGALILLGVGLGSASSPSQAAALSAAPREKAGMASGAISTMRYVGGMIGSAIVAALLGDSSQMQWFALIFPPALFLSAAVALLLPGRVEVPADEVPLA